MFSLTSSVVPPSIAVIFVCSCYWFLEHLEELFIHVIIDCLFYYFDRSIALWFLLKICRQIFGSVAEWRLNAMTDKIVSVGNRIGSRPIPARTNIVFILLLTTLFCVNFLILWKGKLYCRETRNSYLICTNVFCLYSVSPQSLWGSLSLALVLVFCVVHRRD